jgi:hypothetical protein
MFPLIIGQIHVIDDFFHDRLGERAPNFLNTFLPLSVCISHSCSNDSVRKYYSREESFIFRGFFGVSGGSPINR